MKLTNRSILRARVCPGRLFVVDFDEREAVMHSEALEPISLNYQEHI
jgi:hypothetical protein